MAARFCHTPIGTVTFVDENRLWFKATHGLDVCEVPRDNGLCASVILGDGLYVVVNAATDPRSLDNPLVRGEFGPRFYAAAPIITSDGFRLGTMNVVDLAPREVTDDEVATLEHLARLIVVELELRVAVIRAVTAERERAEAAGDAHQQPQRRTVPGERRGPARPADAAEARHCTAIVAIVDAGDGYLDLHPPALLVSPDGVDMVRSSGPILG